MENSPILGPMLRAYQLLNLIQGTKEHQQDREWEQQDRQRRDEVYRTQQQDRSRRVKMEDFDLQSGLANMGAQPGNAGVESALDQLMGPVANPRPRLDTPIGTYFAPTYEEQVGRSALKKRAEHLATTEEVDIPTELGGGKTRVPIGTAMENRIKLFQAANPNLHFESLTDDGGNVTTIGRDPRTGEEIVRNVSKGAGKSKSSPMRVISSTDDNGNLTITTVDPQTGEVIKQTNGGAIGKKNTTSKANKVQDKFDEARVKARALEAEADALEKSGDTDAAAKKRAAAEGARKTAHFYKKALRNRGSEPTAAAASVLPKGEYDALVKKHGKDKVDSYLAGKGITVQ